MTDLRALLKQDTSGFSSDDWAVWSKKVKEAVLEPLYALAEKTPEPDRVAWMIERVAVYGVSHGWWVKGSADPDKPENWTQDPNAATTFPTCESAACAIAGTHGPDYRPRYYGGNVSDWAKGVTPLSEQDVRRIVREEIERLKDQIQDGLGVRP